MPEKIKGFWALDWRQIQIIEGKMIIHDTLRQKLQELRDSFDASVSDPIERDARIYRKYIIFMLGRELFAWPASHISKIGIDKKIIPIPGKMKGLYGVLNYKNRVLSVINLHQMLGLDSVKAGKGTTILVSRGLDVDVAVLVDGLKVVLSRSDDDIKPKPFSFGQSAGELIAGEFYHRGEMITILNPINIIA